MIQVRNREDEKAAAEVTYLPISMGYRQCYRRYMASLGYTAETDGAGAWSVTRDDGGPIDSGEYVSYTTYYAKWLQDYPNLKVSRPVQDICNHCYIYAHRHKFYADHTMRCAGRDDDYDDDEEEDDADDSLGPDNDPEVREELARLTNSVDMTDPDTAYQKVVEQREQMMLDAAEHIKTWLGNPIGIPEIPAEFRIPVVFFSLFFRFFPIPFSEKKVPAFFLFFFTRRNRFPP